MTEKTSFYIRNSLAVLFILVLAIWLIVAAVNESLHINRGAIVIVLGLAGGLIPIMIEFLIAWRNGTLFIRDRAIMSTRQARNKRLGRILLWPTVVFSVTVWRYPGAIKVVLLAFGGGYLLSYGLGLIVHFMKNHKEIYDLTKKQ